MGQKGPRRFAGIQAVPVAPGDAQPLARRPHRIEIEPGPVFRTRHNRVEIDIVSRWHVLAVRDVQRRCLAAVCTHVEVVVELVVPHFLGSARSTELCDIRRPQRLTAWLVLSVRHLDVRRSAPGAKRHDGARQAALPDVHLEPAVRNDPGLDAVPGCRTGQLASTTVDDATGATVERLKIREWSILRNQDATTGNDPVLLSGREWRKDSRIDRVDHSALEFLWNEDRWHRPLSVTRRLKRWIASIPKGACALVRCLVAVALVVLSLPSLASAQGALPTETMSRLAYFSPQRAFVLSSDGKAADAKLSALEAARGKEIAARNAKLKELQDALERGTTVLGDAARRQREIEVERFQVDTKRFVEDAQAEFLGVQRDLENTFFAKLRPALDAVAKERGFLFVFNEDAGLLAWANPALDVTADVVKRLNQP